MSDCQLLLSHTASNYLGFLRISLLSDNVGMARYQPLPGTTCVPLSRMMLRDTQSYQEQDHISYDIVIIFNQISVILNAGWFEFFSAFNYVVI